MTCDGGIRVKQRSKKCQARSRRVRERHGPQILAGSRSRAAASLVLGASGTQGFSAGKSGSQSCEVGNDTAREFCNSEPCPVDCSFGLSAPCNKLPFRAPNTCRAPASLRWEEWSDCSTTCGLGQRFRTRARSPENPPKPPLHGSAMLCSPRLGFEVKSAELYGGRHGAPRSRAAACSTALARCPAGLARRP